MRKFFKLLFSRFFITSILILAEIALLVFGVFVLNETVYPTILAIVTIVLDVSFTLHIINSNMNADYKIAWLVPILALPILGCVLYMFFGKKRLPKYTLKKLITNRFESAERLYKNDDKIDERYAQTDEFFANCAKLIKSEGFLPAMTCEKIEYFKSGEEYAERLYEILKGAKKYIFMEFFIIAKGKFWNNVLDILTEKVKQGVDVRLIYDDFGSIMNLPTNYAEKLKKLGIKCYSFNRYRAILDVSQNNRTHRKIVVVDGEYSFTGGINLADEYINEVNRFGHWKDTGIMIKGRATQNFTAMFFQLWCSRFGKEKNGYEQYVYDSDSPENILCIPFTDSPVDAKNQICENLYIKIISNAKKYVYINTPYLIIDGEMKRALISAAHSGVDVRITVPHIPDKKYVFALTKAFYSPLVKEGIKIYQYTPGFIHAKSIVSDDKYAIIGSSNLDFRSLYLHFECNALIYGEETCIPVRDDYLNTCKISELITEEKIKVRWHSRLYRAILRIFAPLM